MQPTGCSTLYLSSLPQSTASMSALPLAYSALENFAVVASQRCQETLSARTYCQCLHYGLAGSLHSQQRTAETFDANQLPRSDACELEVYELTSEEIEGVFFSGLNSESGCTLLDFCEKRPPLCR